MENSVDDLLGEIDRLAKEADEKPPENKIKDKIGDAEKLVSVLEKYAKCDPREEAQKKIAESFEVLQILSEAGDLDGLRESAPADY